MNTIPLIRRKILPTSVPDLYVHRRAPLSMLRQGLAPSRRLTAVCAGPGYGKTTLVAAYLRELDLPVCWYALEPPDADLATFLAYLLGAIRERFPGMSGRVIDLVRSAPMLEPVLQTVIGLLAEELAELSEDGAVLVLDDFQAVAHGASIAKALDYMVQYLPDSWQLIVISRESLPLPLPQLRVRQQVVELGVRELRFEEGELRELLQRLCAVELTDKEAREIRETTDGWVASVLLAASAVDGQDADPKSLLMQALGHPLALYDYLAEEVLAHQEPAMQGFLLETALLPHIDIAVCREALGYDDAAARLQRLCQANLLVPDGGEGREGYAYHPGFRRFLQRHITQARAPQAVQSLCRRIAAYFAATDPAGALGLFLQGDDPDAAAGLLPGLAQALLANNQVERLGAILEAFPGSSAVVAFFRGEVERLWGNFDRALGLFQQAAALATDDGLRGRALVHQAAIWLGRGEAQAQGLLIEGERLIAPDDLASRGFAHNLQGAWCMASNELESAVGHYEAALVAFRQLGDAVGQAKALGNLGLCHTRFGRFDAAVGTYQEAIALFEGSGRYPPPMLLNNLASVHCYQGQFQEAWSAAERALELAQLLKARRDALYAHLALGFANLGLRDPQQAIYHFEACREAAFTLQDRTTAGKALTGLAEAALLNGQLPRAQARLDEALALTGLPLEDPRQGDLAVCQGLVLLERRDFAAARALLDRLEGEFAGLGFRYRQAQVAFYRARLATAAGEQEANGHWERAIALADAHGFGYLRDQEIGHRQPQAAAVRRVAASEPVSRSAIELACLGELRVRVGEREVASRDWRGYKTKLILAYLLSNPTGVTKEQLADLLYGEQDTSRTAILVLLSRLRHALEPALDRQTPSRFIHFVDGRYGFNFALPHRLDARDFEEHCRQGADAALDLAERNAHWRRAIALYRGDYMAELPADAPWLTIERERYRRAAQEAHTGLTASFLSVSAFAEALEAAEANLKFDGCAESAHRVKMLCLARLGQREAALRHHEVMIRVLERELGSPPAAATLALYQAIKTGDETALARAGAQAGVSSAMSSASAIN